MKEVHFLFQLLSSLYKPVSFPPIPLHTVNLDLVLSLAKKNNLLFYVCQLLKETQYAQLPENLQPKVDHILGEGAEEFKKIENAMEIIHAYCGEYVMIKTDRGYPRIANDLDIVVDDFYGVFDTIKKSGLPHYDFDTQLLEVVFRNDTVAKIHLHGKVGWLNREYFDRALLWKERRNIDFCNTQAWVPSYTTDILLHLAHMNFEPMHVTLSEMLYIFKNAKKVDWRVVYEQSVKYRWSRALIKTLHILNTFHWYAYNAEAPFISLLTVDTDFAVDRRRAVDSYCVLPKSFPRLHIVLAFLGKGVFWEPIKKLPKVMRVLIGGDTYNGFYQAPEDVLIEKP